MRWPLLVSLWLLSIELVCVLSSVLLRLVPWSALRPLVRLCVLLPVCWLSVLALGRVRVAARLRVVDRCRAHVVGRAIGGLDDFKYSKNMAAMGAEGVVWNDETLAAFLAKPKAYIKGTKMSFSGFKKEKDIAATIEYLKSFSE